MKKLSPFLYLCLMSFAAVAPAYAAPAQAATAPAEKSLFQRLGGYDADGTILPPPLTIVS